MDEFLKAMARRYERLDNETVGHTRYWYLNIRYAGFVFMELV